MTPDQPDSADEPFDRETFQLELAKLIDHAREAGVDIKGAYGVRSPHSEHPDYTVEITEIAKHRPGVGRDSSTTIN